MYSWQTILTDVLDNAERQDYSGYSKFDALNSPRLNRLTFNNKWLRLLFTQIVKASPLHIRPLLGVEKSRNPKGIALFARAYFSLFEQTGDATFLARGEALLAWLIEHPSPHQTNLCWGYNFAWQSTLFLQDRHEPNTVVTIFVGEALIHAFRLTGHDKYLKAAQSVARFLTEDLPVIYTEADELAVAYVLRKVNAVVLNNQVLTGAYLAKVWQHTRKAAYLENAIRLINFAVRRKTGYHAWYYTWPRRKSPITHDNYHTGGILDGLLEFFEASGEDRFLEDYWKGLDYYQRHLFEADGAPRWMNDKKYPFDVHGAAQGILTFKKAAQHKSQYLTQAQKVTAWAVNNLYNADRKEFIYRKDRFYKWNYSLMRWCNAWMARALGEMVRKE